jgi:hypothetical protein
LLSAVFFTVSLHLYGAGDRPVRDLRITRKP